MNILLRNQHANLRKVANIRHIYSTGGTILQALFYHSLILSSPGLESNKCSRKFKAKMKSAATCVGLLLLMKLTTSLGYEERMYQPAKWVCSNTTEQTYSDKSQRKLFFNLFHYITGANTQGMDIPMTAPITILRQVLPEGNKSNQMCFYLPQAYQQAPSVPTEENVYIENRPAITVLTRTFGGFAMLESVWENEAKDLQEKLQAAGETNIDFSLFYRATYDAPMKTENRRNEVWFTRKH
ncbi:hypothetical protein OTU49_008832 [Cherax quadricarinatus]|uniref:Uncharacterized protein n=1 Tax=Cherax quadricarinatus TaxID=27406 RepID=A0AAW0WPE5_CHEQU